MRKNVIMLVVAITTLMCFQSCDKDNGTLSEKETLIKYRVTCDTKDAQLYINATGMYDSGLYITGSYEKELCTKDYFAIIEVKCEDPKVAIHVDLYVNNKIRTSTDGNRSVFISERLKGKGPYLE